MLLSVPLLLAVSLFLSPLSRVQCCHSTALWLTANPLSTVYSFDLFENSNFQGSFKATLAGYLQSRFPGRLHLYRGNSLATVPHSNFPPCDLVHIDGKHTYENTMLDFMNLICL